VYKNKKFIFKIIILKETFELGAFLSIVINMNENYE